MFPWNPAQWKEDYLLSFVRQPESARLEYKSGKVLAEKKDRETFIRKQLSPTVSAFANSEGGIIIVGIDEDRKSKPRVAKQLDGVLLGKDHALESIEQFQQIVESCISPFLTGIRALQVRLSGNPPGRYALIVYVPQGTTAYQAKDYIYYSRSEFESKPMPDHEIKFRKGSLGSTIGIAGSGTGEILV